MVTLWPNVLHPNKKKSGGNEPCTEINNAVVFQILVDCEGPWYTAKRLMWGLRLKYCENRS